MVKRCWVVNCVSYPTGLLAFKLCSGQFAVDTSAWWIWALVFGGAVAGVSVATTQEERAARFARVDRDGDGSIGRIELAAWLDESLGKSSVRRMPRQPLVRQVDFGAHFDRLDGDRSGGLSLIEIEGAGVKAGLVGSRCARRNAKGPPLEAALFVAERVGFEPTIRGYRIHTFQACAFDHSATAPRRGGL